MGEAKHDLLRPCPFCGGNAKLVHEHYEGPNGMSMELSSYVQCEKCAARSDKYYVSGGYSSDQLVINQWNKRTNSMFGGAVEWDG